MKKFLLLTIPVAVLFIFLVSNVLKSSDVYKYSIDKAKSDPRVSAILGSPLSEGFLPSGKIKTKGSTGTANLEISVKGPNGEGTILVNATKDMDEWKYQKIVFKDASQTTIDLLNP